MATIDWTRGAQQTWRYWVVDPDTWRDSHELDGVLSCDITRDAESDTLESASLTFDGDVPAQELIVRVYLDATQDGATERLCVGTLVMQTPRWSGDGRVRTADADMFGVLCELGDDSPPVGYSVVAGSDPLASAATAARHALRAPVVAPSAGTPLTEHYVADADETWLDAIRDLTARGGYELAVDAFGRVRFEPGRRVAALAPVRTFDDSNSSVLDANVEVTTDMYEVPNVVQVVWSGNTRCVVAEAANDDESSPLSLAARGRRVMLRVTNPEELSEGCTETAAEAVARKRLADLSHVERTITFAHAITSPLPALGDCVRLTYDRHGIDVRARIVRQVIHCETGGMVECTATWKE